MGIWPAENRRLGIYVSLRAWEVYAKKDQTYALVKSLEKPKDSTMLNDWAIKWRHYGVGAALGYALDFLKVKDWKEKVEKGELLITLLEQELPLSENEIYSRVVKVKEVYGYSPKLEKNTALVSEKKKEIADLIEGYKNLKGIILNVALPERMACTGTGKAIKTLQLQNGNMLLFA